MKTEVIHTHQFKQTFADHLINRLACQYIFDCHCGARFGIDLFEDTNWPKDLNKYPSPILIDAVKILENAKRENA